MDFQLILRIVSFVTATLVLLVGVLMASGYMLPAYIPDNFRVMMGILMVVYGIYRITTLWMKQQKASREIEE